MNSSTPPAAAKLIPWCCRCRHGVRLGWLVLILGALLWEASAVVARVFTE
jgi:hypothetical protein